MATTESGSTGPIRVVVPQSAGSLADRLTRALAEALSAELSEPVSVENRPGQQGASGARHVALEAPADGRTLLMTSLNNICSFALAETKPRFDALETLSPVMGFAEARLHLGTPPNAPWKSFAELIAYGKQRPGELIYGASSSSNRTTTALFLAAVGVKATYRAFDATSVYQQSIADGRTHLGLMPEPAAVGWGTRIRYIAQTGTKRSAAFADSPTFGELGLPNVSSIIYTLSVRAGTSDADVRRLNAAVGRALAVPKTARQFRDLTLDVVNQTPDEAKAALVGHARYLSRSLAQAGLVG